MRIKLIVLFIVICSVLTISAQTKGSQIDQYLLVRSEMGNFSGVVLVAKDNQIILRKAYGVADIEKKIPYTPETQQVIASVSKMFTAFAALQLKNDRKLQLTDSICTYLADCPDIWKPVTIENLIRHTSGIPDYEEALELGSEKYFGFMTQPNTPIKIIENARELPLDFKPGEKFKYSNTAYIILSFIVEKVSKTPFAEYVVKKIFKPAGMKQTGVLGTKSLPKKLANSYAPKTELTWEKRLGGFALTSDNLKKLPQMTLNPPHGDGGIYSTVDDLLRWSQIMDGGSFVSAKDLAEIFSPQYSFGWFIDNEFGQKRFRHNGILPGYLSELIKYPDEKITIIIFSNLDHTRMSVVARDVSAITLGKPFDMPVRGTVISLTKEQISALEGNYKTTENNTLTIQNDPDFLSAYLKDPSGQIQFAAGLIPLSPTEFYFPFRDGKVIFTIGEKGKATKVNLRYRGEDHFAERVIP
ncbi:MAG: beta-lactamase family protein [Pyrinomonadaceae bacterium]|nr:beta-lactamase family protein [Pyrinomonadaceae bacterium]